MNVELTRSRGKVLTIPDGVYSGIWSGHRVTIAGEVKDNVFNLPTKYAGRWFKVRKSVKNDRPVLIKINGVFAKLYKL